MQFEEVGLEEVQQWKVTLSFGRVGRREENSPHRTCAYARESANSQLPREC